MFCIWPLVDNTLSIVGVSIISIATSKLGVVRLAHIQGQQAT